MRKESWPFRLFPNNHEVAFNTENVDDYETAEQVAAAWREQLEDTKGLSIQVVATKPGENKPWGMIPHEGQILIEFPEGRLDPRVIQMVKTHAQVVGLSWGDLFKYFYCPGCGLG